MAQSNINTRWTAPTFSFDTEDQPRSMERFPHKSNRLSRNNRHRPRRRRSTQKGMETNQNDVYRGG